MVAFGIVVFRNPNTFASGGVVGFALLMTKFFPSIPVGVISLVINIFLLIIGYFILGRTKGAGSIYGTLVLSAMITGLEFIFPMDKPLTSQKFLELIYAVFIPGFGTALVFHYGATTGGTDIIAQILSKFFKWKMSISLLWTDILIALGAGLLFGAEACLYSVLSVFLRTFVLDAVMESMRTSKIVVIISDKSMVIQSFICGTLKRSATIHTARGAYTVKEREVITTVVNRRQAMLLQQYIKQEDPGAFITLTNSTEVFGLGFNKFE
jgi:uncharacterized membrane-anchored protein YitT (DUF2179 family)